MLKVDRTALEALIERSHHDDRLHLLVLADEMGVEPDDSSFLEDASEMLSEILEGSDDRFRHQIEEMLGLRHTITMDRITAELVAHGCCDPATACAMAYWIGDDINIKDGATDEMAVYVDCSEPPDGGNPLGRAWVAEGVSWETGGSLVLRHLPSTTLVAAVGRPLRDVVTHPVLDRFDLEITGIEETGMYQVLTTNADRTPLDVAQIMAIRPVHTHSAEAIHGID